MANVKDRTDDLLVKTINETDAAATARGGKAAKDNNNGHGINQLDMLRQTPSPEALRLIPEELARQYRAVPLSVEANTLRVAMADPSDVFAISALSARTKKRIEPVAATAADIQDAIDFNYKAFGDIAKQFGLTMTTPDAASAAQAAPEITDDSPIARALTLIINEAVKSRASDIHIEPESDKLRVRYRIDGILHTATSLPIIVHEPLISRIKILAGMNIADHLRPQDGQISLQAKGRNIDVRVATINTVNGETAVLRLLDKTTAAFSLPQLGFLPESQKMFEKMLKVPYGMMLISGPTGAGKTTTLYAALNSLDKEGRKIITTEDPVEYHFPGMNQVQVNAKAGLTFASALRAIVRLDPDIILVGEVRDSETAQIAIQSALTGHFVLSSVHANDSVGVLFRLIDLGIERFLLCSAIIGIVAQRMVRCVCTHCARKVTVPVHERVAYQRETGEEITEFSYGAGCKACSNTGYHGRTGVYEVLAMTDEIRRLIVNSAGIAEIKRRAIDEGMITLARDGMAKAKLGTTTPFEVLRNVYSAE